MANNGSCVWYGNLGHRSKEWLEASQRGTGTCQQNQSNSSTTLVGHPSQQGASSSTSGGWCQNIFYILETWVDQESVPNVFTGILHVSHINIYVVLDPKAILPFMTPYIVVDLIVCLKII